MRVIVKLVQGVSLPNSQPLVAPNPLGQIPGNLERYVIVNITAESISELRKKSGVLAAYFIPEYMLPIAPDENILPAKKPAGYNVYEWAASPHLDQFHLGEFEMSKVNAIKGGKGEGVSIGDVELGWNFDHEDNYYRKGVLGSGVNGTQKDHGTAVMGLIAADINGFGVNGIAPESAFYGFSAYNTWVESAIIGAAEKLSAGDVILLELQASGPRSNSEDSGQAGFITLEYYPSIFDAISYATSKGIVVVEPAGNGNENLDDPIYEKEFNRAVRDSGAIIVGACEAGIFHRVPTGYTNYGSIVDVFAYGRQVVTSGYGSAFYTNNPNRFYTDRFSGTSSASAIIAGMCACINGIRKTRGLTPFTSVQMRDFLKINGHPADHQYDNRGGVIHRDIGVLPNLFHLSKIASGFPDYDGDNKIGFADFLKFIEHYANKNMLADVNGDGLITLADFTEFASVFGRRWSSR